jgi:hypothetical protein
MSTVAPSDPKLSTLSKVKIRRIAICMPHPDDVTRETVTCTAMGVEACTCLLRYLLDPDVIGPQVITLRVYDEF